MADWDALTEPFSDAEVKQRPGRGGMTFSYVDARTVAARLDEVLGPIGWDFTCETVPGTEVVKGRLVIFGGDRVIVREDHGYPNSDADEEPIKAATSDALKRAAVLFGIGRHLYGDNKPGQRRPPQAPQRPQAVPPAQTSAPDSEDPYADLPWGADEVIPFTGKVPEFAPLGGAQPNVGDECPKHPGEKWRGETGDLYHKKPEGGYCRPDGQARKPKAAAR